MIYLNEFNTGYIIDNNDGDITHVPKEDGNRDYEEIKNWIAEGNIPHPYVEPPENKKAKLLEELDAIIGDLTPAESMFLMLQYGMTKMNPDASDEPAPSIHLTPTGEDIITWGDRIASELEAKMIELRNL